MTPEGKVKAQVKAVLKRYRLWYFMPVSAGYGKHGVPDFICCANGKFIGIECKAKKGALTSLQSQQHIHITAAGGVVLVITEHDIDMLNRYLLLEGAVPYEAAPQ